MTPSRPKKKKKKKKREKRKHHLISGTDDFGGWVGMSRSDLRDGDLERIDGVSVLLHQWPTNRLVQILQWDFGLLCNVPKDRMHHFRLVVPLLTLDDIVWRDTTLGQINIT
jgi:hypothetical protein